MNHVNVFVIQFLRGDSLTVKTYRQAQRAIKAIYLRGLVVTWVFDGIGEIVAEKLHQQVVQVFRPGADDYPVRWN